MSNLSTTTSVQKIENEAHIFDTMPGSRESFATVAMYKK